MQIINPYDRWMRGHHLFFVLIQGLVIAHHDLLESLKLADFNKAQAAFNLATSLYWSSTAAFRFGTDYSAEEYETIVRPSMGPPNYSPGFSDLQSVDHTCLLKLMSQLTPYFKQLPKVLQPCYEAYLGALHAVYDNHAYVCEQFVGKNASLLQQAEAKSVSAAETIRTHYKKRTLKYAGCKE